MKLFKALSVVAVLSLASTAAAQEASTEKTIDVPEVAPNVISVNPLGLLFGSIAVDYERALSPSMSVVIDGRLGLFGFAVGVQNFGVGGGIHFFLEDFNSPFGRLKGRAPAGPWWGPEAAIDFWSASGFASWLSITGGALAGYNWAFGDKNQWVVSLGIGLGVNITTGGISTVPGATSGGFGITGMGRGSIGYAF